MKRFQLFPLCLVFLAVLLTGCQTQEPSVNLSEKNKPSNQTDSSKDPQYSLTDTTAYQGALRLRDKEYCSKISNEGYKKECQVAVIDLLMLENALNTNDTAVCQKLSTEDKQKACALQIDIQKQEQAKRDQQIQKGNEQYQKYQEITLQGDVTKCKNLTDENLKSTCEFYIISNQALQKKDKNACEKITNQNYKQQCIDMVNQSK